MALLAVAAALRLTLAARGWPILNSDEATMGLMGRDVWRLGARPVFTYAQDYIGALQAYLVGAVDGVIGPTPFALRLVTTAQFVVFALVVYALARRLWSRSVAAVSLAILALGPEWALLREIQAGAGAQDTLVFGALVVWLALLRIEARQGSPAVARGHMGPDGQPGGQPGGQGVASARWRWRPFGLDAALGLAIGLGLWGDFLFAPYVAATLLALAVVGGGGWLRARRPGDVAAARAALALGAGEVALGLIGFLVGVAPFIAANVISRGQTLRHAVKLSQAQNGAVMGPVARLLAQAGAALLVGLPQAMGSATLCPGCAVWPGPGATITPGRLLQEVIVAGGFSVGVIGLWLWSALPLGRDIAARFGRLRAAPGWLAAGVEALAGQDARWWGRLMLVVGGALTLLQYVASRVSYSFPASSARYLIGLYICAPLVAAPLVAAVEALWTRWREPSKRGRARHRRPRAGWNHVRWRGPLALGGAVAGSALLALVVGINLAGAAHALAATSDRQVYGMPMGQRDAALVRFLRAHHAANFYAGYWTCIRLEFTSEQALNCAVIDDRNPFAPGFNRYYPGQRAVAADAHPAWVFDLERRDWSAGAPAQVAACARGGQPQCGGDVSTVVAQYLIYYYPYPAP